MFGVSPNCTNSLNCEPSSWHAKNLSIMDCAVFSPIPLALHSSSTFISAMQVKGSSNASYKLLICLSVKNDDKNIRLSAIVSNGINSWQ